MSRNYNAELVSIAAQMGWEGGRAQPILLVGVPGTGKTQFIDGLAHELENILRHSKKIDDTDSFEYETYAIPQLGPDSLEGMGVPNKEHTVLNYLPRAALKAVNDAKFGLIFGDELSSGSAETGASFMAFSQDGRAGDLKVHNRVARIFAMNPPECAAKGRRLSPPEANRFLFIPNWHIPKDDFVDWLRGGKGVLAHVRTLPVGWEAQHGSRTRNLLASFIDIHPQYMNELDNVNNNTYSQVNPQQPLTAQQASNPWTSQRSLTNGFRLMAACLSVGEEITSKLCQLALEGTVGQRISDDFFNWVKALDLPDPEALMTAGGEAAQSLLPQRSDRRKLALEQVAGAAIRTQGFPGIDAEDSAAILAERIRRWNIGWDIVGPVLHDRRDDAYSAARILITNMPSMPEGTEVNTYARLMLDIMKDSGTSIRRI